MQEIEGEKCYTGIGDLPGDVKHLFIATAKKGHGWGITGGYSKGNYACMGAADVGNT